MERSQRHQHVMNEPARYHSKRKNNNLYKYIYICKVYIKNMYYVLKYMLKYILKYIRNIC